MNTSPIKGFSKLSKEAKIEWLCKTYFSNSERAYDMLTNYWHEDRKTQKLHDEFIENTVSNFFLPFGISPNFLINGKIYCIPMAIEESSVIAAASKAANFWLERGGFKTTVVSTNKIGQVHFAYYGDKTKLFSFFEGLKPQLLKDTDALTANMRKRGGGILDIQLGDKTAEEPNYFQLTATFETCDSMGANFINSCLEQFAKTMKEAALTHALFTEKERNLRVIMCILSNYNPECRVRAEVECSIDELTTGDGVDANEFAEKFEQAVHIARIEPYRAVTHNKGIFNGIDAVVIATGNDFRAVEACGHAYAARSGQYRSLTDIEIKDGRFKFFIEIPLALGTVGGITSLHPMVKLANEMLGKPSARELMEIVACAGLAQNFGALRSLVTSGIQKGHMKMHLLNILNQLEATEEEKNEIVEYFKTEVVTHQAVTQLFSKMRGGEVIRKKSDH
jgi:hydroxymethylglutaryl-CoA reductase